MVTTRSAASKAEASKAPAKTKTPANVSRKRKEPDTSEAKSTTTSKRQKTPSKSSSSVVLINRSPVLQLWGACVAHKVHPDLPWSTCLSAGTSVARLCAVAKGKSIGVIEEKDKDEKDSTKKSAKSERLEVMHFKLKKSDMKPAKEELLSKKFGDRYEDVRKVFEESLQSWSSDGLEDLNKAAFHMYEEFRPTVKSGQGGWGKKGELDLDTVRKVVSKA
ncbi:hypothetical protein BT63DRAFT_9849 [Microthyrium microscopicum]|uniref:Uncharacterized protein n=1 Tax=Microthyrium microscopicum TaxID=703497 RepID=A0A6A6USP6_9PEZI|nr:hypothetical protein BT63DRAFT_9849 [Microthyrium microscopicum]